MERTCAQCSQPFSITREHIALLEKVSPTFGEEKLLVPPPTLCPACRQQRRVRFRNERAYYRRSCDCCQKDIIAMYPEGTPFPVYCNDCYANGDWDPLSYGMEYDLDRSFFAQFERLQNVVPRIYFSSKGNENCEYSNHVANCRNCYLLVGSMESEDCHYGHRVFHSRDCLDCLFVEHCELCYECINCEHCYDVQYAFDCHNVRNSRYVERCIGSSNLLYCMGVEQGSFQILNEQLTENEFLKKRVEILASPALQQSCERKMNELRSSLSNQQQIIRQSENCTGNFIVQSHNCSNVYDAHHLEDVQYAYDCGGITDSMDLHSVYGPGSLNYEVYSASIAVHNNLFIRDCWPAEHLIYCDHCFGTRHSFGCIGLGKHQYCILNKQYAKEEYERLVPQIIKSMDAKREWGEYFPADSSPFPIEDTPANPMGTDPQKPFKLIKQEEDFYKKLKLPLPTIHPDKRHELRLERKNSYF